MEVSEAPQGGSSVQKSQMAISESSQESSLQKTSTGQVSSSVATSRNVAESVEKSSSVTSSSIQVQKSSVTSVTEVPSTNGEIKQDNIKATIHEIINDIDRQITEEAVPEPSTIEKIAEPEPPKQEAPKQEPRKELEQSAPLPSVAVQPQQRIPESPPKIPPTVTSMANDDARDDKENGPRVVDLQKIFTPASDAEEIQPSRQRKLYASSSFYSPVLHPTVEDQVELARRISHSLSDISNQHSKGQSMYVNRKKRSVKWVHEGEGKGLVKMYTSSVSHEETTRHESYTHQDKLPLKLVMNPRGQVQDLETLRKQGILVDPTPQSPDRCAEVVNALQATGGKGAELFAKRRKKSEKWVVDETSRASQPTTPMTNMAPVTPAFTDLGVQRAQQTIKLNQIQEKYAQPRVKIVKSPWQTALESGGNVEGAFHEPTVPPRPLPTSPKILPQQRSPPSPAQITRDLAYRPSVPQGWNAPRPHLPLEQEKLDQDAEAEEEEEVPHMTQDVTENLQVDPDDRTLSDLNEIDYRKVPVKALIDTFEKKKGIYTPPELPLNSYAPPPRVDLPPPQEPPTPIRRPQPPPVVPSAIQRAPQSPIYAPQRPKATPVIQMAPQTMPQPVPQPMPQPTPQPIHGAPVGKWRNYNTAARGWRGADIYRPVTFDQITPQLPFTDF